MGPRLGPIKPDDLPKASKTGMSKVHLLWPYRGSNQHPITGVNDGNYRNKLKSVRREKSLSIWPESSKNMQGGNWVFFKKCADQIKVSHKTQLSRTKPDPDQAKAGPNQSTEHMSITIATPKLILSVLMRILLGPYKFPPNQSRNNQEMYMIFSQSLSP